MFELSDVLLGTSALPARWDTGDWTALHGWTHILSDLAIWGAYTAIPILITIAAGRRRDFALPRIVWLFVIFILACGASHLVDAITFWLPIYWLGALAKGITAVVSWGTVVVLIYYGPQLLRIPSITEINLKLSREVRERRRTERRLEEQAQLLQLALSAGQVGTWRWDLPSNQDMRDAGFNEILGLDPKSTTQSVEDSFGRIHYEDQQRARDALHAARNGEEEYSVEVRVIRPDKTIRWIRNSGVLVRDEEENESFVTGAIVDITDMRHAEEGQARLAAVVESSPDGILTQSPDGDILTWNAGAERIFGYTAEEAVGHNIALIIPNDRVGEAERYRAAAKRGEKIPHFETMRRCKDGRLIDVWLAVSAITDSRGRITALSTVERDVTERNRYEDRLRKLNRKLKAKNDEMEQFVYIVSHDLKSPLVTMIGFVGLLREDLGEDIPEGVADGLDRIDKAAVRMGQLVDDLLELSRIGRVKRETQVVDLAPMLRDLRDDLTEALRSVDAELVIENDLGTVEADPRRLQQVLQNLLTNAVKYGCDKVPCSIWVGTERDEHETRIYVRDIGPGIAEEHHARIFRLFEQGDAGKGGTGVGLALVQKIMLAHDGRAWVTSTVGAGATFWVAFPNASRVSRVSGNSESES